MMEQKCRKISESWHDRMEISDTVHGTNSHLMAPLKGSRLFDLPITLFCVCITILQTSFSYISFNTELEFMEQRLYLSVPLREFTAIGFVASDLLRLECAENVKGSWNGNRRRNFWSLASCIRTEPLVLFHSSSSQCFSRKCLTMLPM